MATELRSEKYFYTTIADSFESLMNPYDVRRRIEIIFDKLLDEDLRGKLLLDAGAGTGYFSEQAAARGANVVSVDLGTSLLRKVAGRAGTLLTAGDVTLLPFPSSSFDYVISSEVIEHTPDPQAAVLEFGRVLKPGGTLLLTCPNRVWEWLVRLHPWPFQLRPLWGLSRWVDKKFGRTFWGRIMINQALKAVKKEAPPRIGSGESE